MSITSLLKNTWQGIVYLSIGFVVLTAVGIVFKLWQITLGIIGAFLLIILAMLFGIPRWIKIIGGVATIIFLFLWLGAGIFFQSLLIAIAIAWVFNNLKN